MRQFGGSLKPDEFWLGEVRIIPSERTILRDNNSSKIELKAMDVLLYLANRQGEVVSREDIMDAVWPRAEITDDVLSRAIYQLRKALGDESKRPRFIATIPKTGYRLLIPQANESTADTDSDTLVTLGSKRGYERKLIWSLASVVLLGVAGYFLVPKQQESEPTARINVGFIPIVSQPAPDHMADLDLLALSLNDMLRVRTAEFQSEQVSFRMLPTQNVRGASERRNIFDQNSFDVAFYGWLEDSPGVNRAALTIEVLSRNKAGTVVATPSNIYEIPYFTEDSDLARLDRYRSAIAERIITMVHEDVPFAMSLPYQLFEGFRLLLHAEQALYLGVDCGVSAESLLLRSLELMPQVARTHNRLGQAYWTQAWECGRSGGLTEKAIAELKLAMALDPENYEAVHMYTAILAEMGRLEDAYTHLARYLESFPDQPYLLFSEIIILQYAGLLDLSIARVEQVLADDPLALVTEMVDMPSALFYAEDYQRFLELSPATNMANMMYHRAYALWQLGRREEAMILVELAQQTKTESIYRDYSKVLSYLIQQDIPMARATIHAAIDRRQIDKPITTDMAFRDAQLLALSGDSQAAIKSLNVAADKGFICPSCYENHSSLANVRDRREFPALLKRVQQKQRRFIQKFAHVIYR